MTSQLEKRTSNQINNQFETHIIEVGTALYQYIFSLVKHKELAEDLYQDVLVCAYIGFSSFKKKASFKSWIFTIAKNRCYDHWRKQQTEQRFWEEGVYEYSRHHLAAINAPESYVIAKNTMEEVVGEIYQLPKKYSEPLLLFYYQERSLGEISEQTAIPVSTVKTRLRRARIRLRPKVAQLAHKQRK